MSTLYGIKILGIAGLVAAAAISVVPAALAEGSQVCLQSRDIDHTKILNDHQIVFYMTGHKAWVNNLPNKCTALREDLGFTHVSSTDEYCDNLETIKVRPTNEPCLLGKFTPYEKPAS
jgi:hypothetical protein